MARSRADGQILATYLHGLFEQPRRCAALLRWAGLAQPLSDRSPSAARADARASGRCGRVLARCAAAVKFAALPAAQVTAGVQTADRPADRRTTRAVHATQPVGGARALARAPATSYELTMPVTEGPAAIDVAAELQTGCPQPLALTPGIWPELRGDVVHDVVGTGGVAAHAGRHVIEFRDCDEFSRRCCGRRRTIATDTDGPDQHVRCCCTAPGRRRRHSRHRSRHPPSGRCSCQSRWLDRGRPTPVSTGLLACRPYRLPPGWTADIEIGGGKAKAGQAEGVGGIGLLRRDHAAAGPLFAAVRAGEGDRADPPSRLTIVPHISRLKPPFDCPCAAMSAALSTE